MPDEPNSTDPPVRPKEPEGGPKERQRQFLEERFTPLRPKDTEAREAPFELPNLDTPPAPDAPARERSVPPAPVSRKKLVEQYRQRQRAQIESRTPPAPAAPSADAPAEEEDADSGEPSGGLSGREAAAAPPANNWIPIGPSVLRQGQAATLPPTSGRTPAIAVAPGGQRLYIGAANGGVWRSEDEGLSWQSLMEAFDLNPDEPGSDSLACGAIALAPGAAASQDRIYVGSGEGAGMAYSGVGPIVSLNGGQTWTTEPVSSGSTELEGQYFWALAVDPADKERVVAATTRGIYRREETSSGSGSYHWVQKNVGSAATVWATSVVVASTGAQTTFYAAFWGGPVVSSSSGHTWTQVGAGFPTANVGRIGLAVRPTDPSVVYALVHNSPPQNGSPPHKDEIQGVWRLDTSDNTWRPVAGHPADLFGLAPRGQGSYDLAIAVDPNNASRLYLGGSTKKSGGEWSGSLYRSTVSSSGSGSAVSYSMSNSYIGGSTHADIHTLVFAPGDSNKLWVGCDGGVFYTTNPTGSGNIFESRNLGLSTLTMEHLGQHPTEDAVVFCGTQDNGGVRFTGEEAWLHSVGGDCGFSVVNWNDPYRVISTYVRAAVNRTFDGGTRYKYFPVDVPIEADEPVLFYAPLAGTPYRPGSPSEAERVAFGSVRPWISDLFGGGWTSLPKGTASDRLDSAAPSTDLADRLPFRIRSLIFASYRKLYAGLMNGRVYRYDQSPAGVWSRKRLDNKGGSNSLGLAGPVTDIAIDYSDTTGNSIYITFGGFSTNPSAYRRVWHFNGSQWQQRAGPSAGHVHSLLNLQHNAVVTDPVNVQHVYAGADIGIWRSTDGGANWSSFSEGLPDAGVMDLKLHNPRRLLRASTHGRGVYERTLDSLPKQGIELYVRDTQLDQGRFPTINGLPDPAHQGKSVFHYRGPDIKLDTPDTSGSYQFPLIGDINFYDFVETLNDDSLGVATHTSATITTRVYVQVHNRGVTPAYNVRVMCLLANACAGLPALPAGFEANVQSGTPINTADWQTVGIDTLQDVRVGHPRIAAFNLTSDKLPPPANLAGNNHHCVLALVHHDQDQFTNTQTHTDTLSLGERKSAHKNLKVVQFTGNLPAAPPIVIPVRLSNADLERDLLTALRIHLNGYFGRVRLFVPPLQTDAPIEQLLDGLSGPADPADFIRWAPQQLDRIRSNQAGASPYNTVWAGQHITDIEEASAEGKMFEAESRQQIGIRRIRLSPAGYRTVYLILDRPPNVRVGESFEIFIEQNGVEGRRLIGGMDLRVEVVSPSVIARGGVIHAALDLDIVPASPRSLVSIFGVGLAPTTAVAQVDSGNRLPLELGGARVRFGRTSAPILYVSPTQINVQVPDIPHGLVPVTVETSEGASPAAMVEVDPVSPGIFGATKTDFTLVTDQNPVHPGEAVILWTSGLGRTDPPILAGDIPPVSPLARTIETPEVLIAGQRARVISSVLSPGFAGVEQVAVIIPEHTTAGPANACLKIESIESNTIQLFVSAGP